MRRSTFKYNTDDIPKWDSNQKFHAERLILLEALGENLSAASAAEHEAALVKRGEQMRAARINAKTSAASKAGATDEAAGMFAGAVRTMYTYQAGVAGFAASTLSGVGSPSPRVGFGSPSMRGASSQPGYASSRVGYASPSVRAITSPQTGYAATPASMSTRRMHSQHPLQRTGYGNTVTPTKRIDSVHEDYASTPSNRPTYPGSPSDRLTYPGSSSTERLTYPGSPTRTVVGPKANDMHATPSRTVTSTQGPQSQTPTSPTRFALSPESSTSKAMTPTSKQCTPQTPTSTRGTPKSLSLPHLPPAATRAITLFSQTKALKSKLTPKKPAADPTPAPEIPTMKSQKDVMAFGKEFAAFILERDVAELGEERSAAEQWAWVFWEMQKTRQACLDARD